MSETPNLSVVIPAAGASSRMGRPKALLPVNKKTIIENQIGMLRRVGLYNIFVVTDGGEQFADKLKRCDVQVISPVKKNKSMIESIRCSMAHFNGAFDGMMVVPSDFPYLSTELLVRVLTGFERRPKRITVPVYQGKRGHPVIIPSRLFDAVNNRFDDYGIRGLYDAFPDSLAEIDWEDDSILKNMNTENDYKAYLAWTRKSEK